MRYIAWVSNRWIESDERAELIETYTSYLDMIDEKYPNQDDMTVDVVSDYLDKAYELERLERIHRCESDLLQFAIEYFSEAKNPENDGNWDGFDISDKAQSPEFHREITDIMNTVSTEYINAKIAVAAPRSHAKSSYLSKAFPIHEVVYRKRKYVIIISETPNVSKGNMEWIRNQMKFNRKLREDFGPLLSPKEQSNIQDNSESFIAWYPKEGGFKKQVALVEAASTGQALRGRNWNGTRPDLVVLDDLEDARPGGNASTPEQRAKLKDWFSQTVIPLGDPKGKRTAFVYMGTTVHFESLLMDVLHNNPDFESKVFKAIIEYPKRMDLWDECQRVYTNRDNKNRKEDAEAFFRENEEEMLDGSKVLWEDAQPLFKLMKWKWTYGSKAFNTEYMNNPIDEESMIFNPETFTYWDGKMRLEDFFGKEFVIGMGIDFALGKEKGDYPAISVVVKHKEKDLIYVVDSYLERVQIDYFFDVIVEKVKYWQPDIIAADANAMQEVIAGSLEKRLQQEGYPATTRMRKIKNRGKKAIRIEAMKLDIDQGGIRFTRRHQRLLEQFERYGQGAHDDGPDSLQMAVESTSQARRRKAGNAGTYRY
ncbi:phage terminase large subunit [Virgibacillus pantothenticus]|uniref:phage terminase large subunit n=1 Tax=Virgibacillus pantothenticus TaxID=1473 RepID=UPI002014CDCE|nr:phage terminase large subunit [Virgibacillus pantothenticus]